MSDNKQHPHHEHPKDSGPADPGHGKVEFNYSSEGKMPLFMVFVWATFFAFMLYYVGTWMVPALIQELGTK